MKTQDRVVGSPAALYVLSKRQIGDPNELGQSRNFAKQFALPLWIVSKCRLTKYAAGLVTRLPYCNGAS